VTKSERIQATGGGRVTTAEFSLRILVLHSTYLSGPASGENRIVEDEVKLLRERGHQVSALTPSPPTNGLAPVRLAGRALWSTAASKEVEAVVREARPDVMHGHNLFPMISPAVIRIARRERIPFVMTLHNYRLMCLPGTFLRDERPCEDCLGRTPWPGVLHACYRGSSAASAALASSLVVHRTLRSFDGVSLYLASSQFMRDRHIAAGILPGRILCKPNFAWPAARREGAGDYFLYVGRVVREKGLHTLMEAWRQVDAPLLIAGDGELRPELEETAPSRVRFLGSVPHAEALGLLRAARATILPSIWYEGAPRAIPEAYAAGVPAVASDIGSMSEFVDEGRSGLLIPPGDPEALAGAVRELLDDARSSQLGEGAYRSWVEEYTPQRGAAELEGAYMRVIESVGGGPAIDRVRVREER
jgi:glycosyltransferase involved in cell wall biosynthesis